MDVKDAIMFQVGDYDKLDSFRLSILSGQNTLGEDTKHLGY